MIGQYLSKKLLDGAFDIAKKVLNESNTKLHTNKEYVEQSIALHLRDVKNWSKSVSFSDIKKAKQTTDIFIHLDLFVYPRRLRFETSQPVETIPLNTIFDYSDDHLVILGQPGAGKTTSMKYLCQALFKDEEFHSERFSFPILIRLRDLNNITRDSDSTIILDRICNILGLKIEFPTDLATPLTSSQRMAIKEKLALGFIDQLQILLILDGFDELALLKDREEAIKDIRTLASHLDQSTLIVTSRTGDFTYSVDNASQYELCPLSQNQISIFAMKWLNSQTKADDFLTKIYESPFADTAIRPLTLAHLCAIYEREGRIPDKPKTVYRKIVGLLLEEWDHQRSVRRYSQYAKFESDRKFEFLCHLAFLLTTWLEKTVFSDKDLLQVYNKICRDYGLTKNEAKQVVTEIETHTGLFLQSGYESFEFAHKSLQEYLTAEYLVRLPTIPISFDSLSKLPSELAVAVVISSRPNLYFIELVNNRFLLRRLSEDFLEAFLSRLFLEKPDFAPQPQFCLSLITVFSFYAELNINKDDRIEPFYRKRVITQLESVIDSSFSKNVLNLIKVLYQAEKVYDTDDGNTIHCLLEKEQLRRPERISLPKRLYLRTSWLEKALESS